MHLDNLLFILLIAMAALLRLLASKAGKGKKQSEAPRERSTTTRQLVEPVRRRSGESDQERIRKFLEALGQPATSAPPLPVVPRADTPPRPLAPVQPPIRPLSPRAWELTREERRKRRNVLSETPHAAPPVFEVHEVAPHKTETVIPAATPPMGLQAPPAPARGGVSAISLLRSPSGLRNAIILREIFGPPRSLQSFDLIGSA